MALDLPSAITLSSAVTFAEAVTVEPTGSEGKIKLVKEDEDGFSLYDSIVFVISTVWETELSPESAIVME